MNTSGNKIELLPNSSKKQKHRKRAMVEKLNYPDTTTIARIANFLLSDYEGRNTTHKSPMPLSTDEQEQRMKNSRDLIRTALEGTETFADWAKAVNGAKRILSKRETPRPPIGEKVKKLIDILQYRVIYAIKKLEKSNYEAARQYVQGENRIFTLEVSTALLVRIMNRDSHYQLKGEGSFRGPKGMYAALREVGFIFRKYNKSSVDGRETKKGAIVCLDINLEWVFGFFLVDSRGNSTTKENPLKNYITENMQIERLVENLPKSSVENEASEQANFQQNEVMATKVANHSEAKRQISQQPAYVSASPQNVYFCARRAVELLLGVIYTPSNFETNKIRVNKETALRAMPQGNDSIMITLMCENINVLLKEGQSLSDIEVEIAATIVAKNDYINRVENKYCYPPVKFLEVATKGGLLWVLKKRRETAKEPFQKIESVGEAVGDSSSIPSVPAPIKTKREAQILWFIEQGAYDYAVQARVKKWGVNAVGAAIALGAAKIKRGFKTKQGLVPYIFGIIDGIESVEQIEHDSAQQVALYKANIPFGTPKPKTAKEKEAKKATNYTPTAIIEIAMQKGLRISVEKATQWAERLKDKTNAEILLESWISETKRKNK